MSRDDRVFAGGLARSVGEWLLGQTRRSDLGMSHKADFSLVTEADVEADRRIRSAIREAHPDDVLLSEELAPHYDHSGRRVWIVDPIDGTSNFALGLPLWGVSIALVIDGMPAAAAIHFPALNQLFTAAAGAGADCNGRVLGPTGAEDRGEVGFLACCSRTLRYFDVTLPLKARVLGAASYTLCTVASGGSLVAFETTPKIWDIAAAGLIVEEAGGSVEIWDGPEAFPLRTGIDYRSRDYPTVAAASPAMMRLAREHIRRRVSQPQA